MKKFINIPSILVIAALTLLCVVSTYKFPTARDQQIESFSEEPEKFPIDLMLLVKDQISTEEEFIIKVFTNFWNSDSLTIEQKAEIISISNDLLKKTVTSTKHFVTYVSIIIQLPKNQSLEREYVTCSKGLQHFAQQEEVPITWLNSFLSNSLALFTRNAVFIDLSHEWKASNDHYSFHFSSLLTLQFDNTNLICKDEKDSIAILSTSGIYYPIKNAWKGNGGKVTWIRSKLPENEIFATLTGYKIDFTKNDYEADSVWFTNLDYFDQPALGRLKDNVIRSSRPENITVPEFNTYGQRQRIENLFDGVDYDGGYYMMGGKLIGTGTRENPARIEITKDNKDFLRIESKTYIFQRHLIVSDNAQVRFKMGTDSLFHTGLGFA